MCGAFGQSIASEYLKGAVISVRAWRVRCGDIAWSS
jgi:hypothetical protein